MNDPKKFVKCLLRVAHLIKPTCCTCKENNTRFGLQYLSQSPACVPVTYIPEHHVQILDNQDNAPVLLVGKIQQCAKTPIFQRPIVLDRSQILNSVPQVDFTILVERLLGQPRQALQPKLPGG